MCSLSVPRFTYRGSLKAIQGQYKVDLSYAQSPDDTYILKCSKCFHIEGDALHLTFIQLHEASLNEAIESFIWRLIHVISIQITEENNLDLLPKKVRERAITVEKLHQNNLLTKHNAGQFGHSRYWHPPIT